MPTPDTSLHLDGAFFVDGRWVPAAAGNTREVVNPFDGSALQRIDEGDGEDAASAVAAARRAFDSGVWSSTPASARSSLLLRVADLLERNKARIAELETLDTGKTLRESEIDVDDVASVFRYYAALALGDPGRLVDTGNATVLSRVVYEPVKLSQEFRNFEFLSPWEGTDYVLPGDEKAKA